MVRAKEEVEEKVSQPVLSEVVETFLPEDEQGRMCWLIRVTVGQTDRAARGETTFIKGDIMLKKVLGTIT